MTSNRDRAAEVLAQDRCWIPGPGGMERFSVAEGADALAAAGLLAPDLPAPTWEHSTTWDVPGEHEWQTDTHKGEVMLEVDIEEPGHFAPLTTSKLWVMKRDEASALALALLAAAAHVQEEETNE